MFVRSQAARTRRRQRRRTSVFVVLVGGFLVGFTAHRGIPTGQEGAASMLSAALVISWLGLRFSATRWSDRQEQSVRELRAARLAHRIDRHIPRGRGGMARPPHHVAARSERTYLPVVRSSRAAGRNFTEQRRGA